MGLDFRTGGIPWSYSGFNRFRRRLARSCGFTARTRNALEPVDDYDRINAIKLAYHIGRMRETRKTATVLLTPQATKTPHFSSSLEEC
jgi:hypothetical protein